MAASRAGILYTSLLKISKNLWIVSGALRLTCLYHPVHGLSNRLAVSVR